MKKKRAMYAGYNGSPWKAYDFTPCLNTGERDFTRDCEEVWCVYVHFNPVDKSRQGVKHITYLRSEGLHFGNKAWVEKAVYCEVEAL